VDSKSLLHFTGMLRRLRPGGLMIYNCVTESG
jgi:hypothetical protein